MANLVDRVATTCLCWRVVRADGMELRLTEHDRAIEIDGETFEPGAAFETSSFTATSNLSPGHASISGALSSEAITQDDVAAGLWDRARVSVFRADWRTSTLLGHVWSGRLSEVRCEGVRLTARLVSLKADLQTRIGRIYSRKCDAWLGDSRCKVDLSDPAHAGKACDQSFATCCAVFGNGENFRGFPHMPGADFLLAGPDRGRAHDT